MDASEVFGEIWFWIAAAVFWSRAALSAYGAPRRLIAAGLRELGPARLARDLVRYRLGPGSPAPLWFIPLRLPAAGALAAYLLAGAVYGDALSAAALTGLGPIVAATMALEPRVLAAAQAGGGDAEVAAFADALEQVWRIRLAATIGAIFLTASVAALMLPG